MDVGQEEDSSRSDMKSPDTSVGNSSVCLSSIVVLNNKTFNLHRATVLEIQAKFSSP